MGILAGSGRWVPLLSMATYPARSGSRSNSELCDLVSPFLLDLLDLLDQHLEIVAHCQVASRPCTTCTIVESTSVVQVFQWIGHLIVEKSYRSAQAASDYRLPLRPLNFILDA